MSERHDYPAGVPCWVDTIQPDQAAAGAFYGAVLGWDLIPADVERPGASYLLARVRGSDVAGIVPMPPMIDPPPDPTWVTHVRVDRVEESIERVQAAGGQVVVGPMDVPPVGRMGVLTDPAGAVFNVWEARTRRGAQRVNEPGAWAMSRLDTPDPERAAAFYGEVFGWTTESFAVGEATVTLFRVPGYVGGEPGQPVSREVVAVMAQAPDGQPAAWAVDFWVADVDAASQAAADAGGTVVAGPMDMPMGRTAVLADPAGATFSVSRVTAAG